MSTSTWSLKTLQTVPDDFSQALFAHYPAMKLGVIPSVDFYVDKLAELAKGVLQEYSQCRDWVLTAPPFIAAPAAANLLCWRLHSELMKRGFGGYRFTVVDLHYETKVQTINNENDFKLRYEYSNNSLQDRIKERARLKDDIAQHKSEFSNKGVLVINDILVTGTQQKYLSRSFSDVQPTHLNWLYIFEINKDFGEQYPQIEHEINTSGLQSLSDYQAVIGSNQTQYTARCLSRLFNYELDEFRFLVESLKPERKGLLLDLVLGEQRFQGEYFIEKFNILNSLCGQALTARLS